MLIDTDVFIWYLRGNENSYLAIKKAGRFQISVITYMELVQGMRSKQELAELQKALKSWDTKILYLSENISTKAMFYVEQYYLSHSMQLADALIGATAMTYATPIMTGNDKHYKAIKGMEIKVFRP